MKLLRIAVIAINKIEDIELIVPVDIWRRAGIQVQIISLDKKKNVVLQNGIKISCDDTILNENLSKYNAIYLPGGEGCEQYKDENAKKLLQYLSKIITNDKIWILAACKAPVILNELNLLNNVKATCYPSFSNKLNSYVDENVVVDQNFITTKGPATMFEFAFKTIEILLSKEKANEISQKILYNI